MVNRTKISKEIRRRGGGVPEIGEGKTIKQINLWKDKWEQIPGTGTSTYNPAKFRLKKKPELPEKKRTEKPVGVGKKDVEQAKAERERLRKAGSLDVGHPRTAVKRKSIDPPLGYKEAQAKAAKRATKIKEEIKMEGVDPEKHKDLQKTIRRADRIAAEKLAEKKRKRELGEYNLLTWESKGGQPKRSKKKPTKIKKRPWKHPTRYAKAGGQVSYQGHDGNKVISKYYD